MEQTCLGQKHRITNPFDRVCGELYSRGLCQPCYQLARRWEVLDKVALPVAKRGRKKGQVKRHCATCTCSTHDIRQEADSNAALSA